MLDGFSGAAGLGLGPTPPSPPLHRGRAQPPSHPEDTAAGQGGAGLPTEIGGKAGFVLQAAAASGRRPRRRTPPAAALLPVAAACPSALEPADLPQALERRCSACRMRIVLVCLNTYCC